MPGSLLCTLIADAPADPRSNYIAYRLTVANHGTGAVRVLSIVPRIPDGAKLLEVRDPSLDPFKAKHAELCGQLTMLVSDYIFASSAEWRARVIQAQREAMKQIISTTGILRVFFGVFTGWFSRWVEESYRTSKAFSFTIESAEHAELALNKFLGQADTALKEIFSGKISQLKEVEAQMAVGAVKSALATVDPDCSYEVTYVLRFKRSLTTTRQYNVSFDVSCSQTGNDTVTPGGATVSQTITPTPYSLTLFAIASSILGVCLRQALAMPETQSFWTWSPGRSTDLLAASIIALVFYNVYEYTDIGKKIPIGVGWRSALLLGFLCGLMGDRIVMALKTFITSQSAPKI